MLTQLESDVDRNPACLMTGRQTMETFYTGGACNEHLGNHFWLKTRDLAAVGLPPKGADVGALTVNGLAVNVAHMGPSKPGSGCAGCCAGCALTIFQISPFSIASGENAAPSLILPYISTISPRKTSEFGWWCHCRPR